MKEKLKKLLEQINIFEVKRPSLAILIKIFLFNVVFCLITALVISYLVPASNENTGFWASVFYSINMILDPGCIANVITNLGEVSVALIFVCIITVIVGMITFTGSVIGYVTSQISDSINNARNGNWPLMISRHIVILGWNSRASEVINDMLFTGKKETVVVLAKGKPEKIQREIRERISSTIKENHIKNRVSVIVRSGETFSTKQLTDISISQAKSVILMAEGETPKNQNIGNCNTIKTLLQVAEMTSAADSADHQSIIVEVEDAWTEKLVNQIIHHKEKLQKCHIIPVPVNKVLGQMLSQFSIMPELNLVYSELLSNKGAAFFYKPYTGNEDSDSVVADFMQKHDHAVPLAVMETTSGKAMFAMADNFGDLECTTEPYKAKSSYNLNNDYHLQNRNIVIIGHNSKCKDIMNGFTAFSGEQDFGGEHILGVTVIDTKKSLERNNYYQDYPYVIKTVEADVYDEPVITKTLEEAIDGFDGTTSILILSDDTNGPGDDDAAALTYLIYVQDIAFKRANMNLNPANSKIDLMVEILNPKNFDVVHSYNINNIVISNRYISKMITQIGSKQPLFEFHADVFTYDDPSAINFVSKEIYVKKVENFFQKGSIPAECSARELISGVYEASPEDNKAVVLGITREDGSMSIFSGCLDEIKVQLLPSDKLIVYSNH